MVAKKATFLVGGEMNSFFGKRIAAAGGVTVWSVPAGMSSTPIWR